jgi:hypothetical protein
MSRVDGQRPKSPVTQMTWTIQCDRRLEHGRKELHLLVTVLLPRAANLNNSLHDGEDFDEIGGRGGGARRAFALRDG